MKKLIYSILVLITCSITLYGQEIKRVEPLNWWVGMKTPLQLMVYGENIGEYNNVTVNSKDIDITNVTKAESANYLFIDINTQPTLAAGEYTFTLKNKKNKTAKFNYSFLSREANSAKREGFNSSDAIYLLMPDRFVNADITNDSIAGYPDKANRNEFFGRYGGDLEGMIQKLDYLEDLGITAIWSTPITEDNEPNTSYHGYACSDYYKIDPRFGSNEQYKEFVKQADKRGIKVIMDVVTNHCGSAHWWMKDLPFKNWIHQFDNYTQSNYVLTTNYDPNASKEDLDWCINGWFDKSMPDMALENPYVLQYFKQLYIWWIEWAGLNGLRVDTHPYNGKEPIADWAKAIRNEYPNISIVGECWLNEPAYVAYWEGNKENFDGYNSNLTHVMDFPLMGAFSHAVNTPNPGWGEGMNKIYAVLSQDFLYKNPGELMIFLSNHDTDRWADVVKRDPKKIKMGIALLGTMRGMPQIYVGDELGLVSDNLEFGHGGARVMFPTELTKEQEDILSYTKHIFKWRKNKEVIHNGKTTHYNPINNVYSFIRHNNKEAVLVIANGSNDTQQIDWSRYKSILSNYPQKDNLPKYIESYQTLIIEF